MKFGKRIRGEALEQWEDCYVDYKGLKHILNPMISECEGSEKNKLQESFVSAILKEIDKVDAFFTAQEIELYAEFRNLCQKVSQAQLDVSSPVCCQSLEKLVHALEGTQAGCLIREFLSFSTKVDRMRKFVMINTLAVIKITKKHDKHSSRQLQWEMVDLVHRRHFYNSCRFGSLITDTEVLASQMMSRLTKTTPSPECYSCPICLGILCNPVVLSCGHRFCMKCVSAATYFCQISCAVCTAIKLDRQTSCPVCRKEQILDLEHIKVDTLLSHFLDRYFPQGQSGVQQCRTCAARRDAGVVGEGRQRLPCEECNLEVLRSIDQIQAANIDFHQRQWDGTSLAVGGVEEEAGAASKSEPIADALQGAEVEGLAIRPRFKRRSVGEGGKQALGGRPEGAEAEAAAAAAAAPVVLNAMTLRAHFNLPLNDAAKRLGVCATAIKKVCRKIGIKQWPHRKLKAVEKRLGLLQAESRYTNEEAIRVAYESEIRELEEKRKNLLQGIDCDIAGVNDCGENMDDDGDAADQTKKPRVRTRPSASRYPRGPALRYQTPSTWWPGNGAAAVGDGGIFGNDAGTQGVAEVQRDNGVNDLPAFVTASAGLTGLLEGEAVVNRQQSAHELGCEVGGGQNSEQDVWDMLHRMIDDPSALDCAARANPTAPKGKKGSDEAEAGPGTEKQDSLPPDSMQANNETSEAEKFRLLQRVRSLEEEVMHLRQFSMTLMKERGELALQLSRREQEVANLRLQCERPEVQGQSRVGATGEDSSLGLGGHAAGGADFNCLSQGFQQEGPW